MAVYALKIAKIVIFVIFLSYKEPENFNLESKYHINCSGLFYWGGKATKIGIERFKLSTRGHNMSLSS